jgi:hypothetical protein
MGILRVLYCVATVILRVVQAERFRMARKFIPIEPYLPKLEQALRLGATYKVAAAYAGISEATFIRWRQRAEHAAPGTPLAELRDRIAQAEGHAAIFLLAKIDQAAKSGDWHAAAWLLSRRYPHLYGPNVRGDLQLDMQRMMADVAQEYGITPELLAAEATAFLKEYDLRHR